MRLKRMVSMKKCSKLCLDHPPTPPWCLEGISTVLSQHWNDFHAIGRRECCVAEFHQEQLAAKEAEIAELKEMQLLADTILPSTDCLWFVVVDLPWFADVCSESQPLLLYAFVCFDRFWSLGSIRIQSMPVFHYFSPTIWKLMDVNKKRKVENKSPQRCALIPRLRKEQEMKEIRHEERLENEAERRNLCTQSGTNMCHSVWYSISHYYI